MEEYIRSPLPFSVAVTGHRDISKEDEGPLQSQIEDCLTRLHERLRDTAPTECNATQLNFDLRFLSPLAEGADQIAASAALAVGDLGWELHAILPFARDAYVETFDDSTGAQLDALLTRASRIFEIADIPPEHAKSATALARPAGNSRRFETLGRVLVRQCDVLIAVWRGEMAMGAGGTGEVVAHALLNAIPVIVVHPERHSVESLRLSAVNTSPKIKAILPFHGVSVSDGADAAIEAATSIVSTSRTNIESLPTSGWKKTLLRALSQLYPAFLRTAMFGTPEGGHPATMSDQAPPLLSPQSNTIDSEANFAGNLYRSTYILIFSLAAFAVGAALVGLFPALSETKPIFVSIELVILIVALALWFQAIRGRFHETWLELRYRAETVRALAILAPLGFTGRLAVVGDAEGDGSLVSQDRARPGLPDDSLTLARMGDIASQLQALLSDQIDYHTRNATKLNRFHHRLDKAGLSLIAIAAIISLFYVLVAFLFHDWRAYPTISAGAAIAGGFFPALAGALSSIRYHGDFERFAHHSAITAMELDHQYARTKSLRNGLARQLASREVSSVPIYEELLHIATSTNSILEKDLESWRFANTSRPTPLP